MVDVLCGYIGMEAVTAIAYSKVALVLWSGHYVVFGVQPRVVGCGCPVAVDSVAEVSLYSIVFYLACVDVLLVDGLYQVVSL